LAAGSGVNAVGRTEVANVPTTVDTEKTGMARGDVLVIEERNVAFGAPDVDLVLLQVVGLSFGAVFDEDHQPPEERRLFDARSPHERGRGGFGDGARRRSSEASG
jgi:hypothetical protein